MFSTSLKICCLLWPQHLKQYKWPVSLFSTHYTFQISTATLVSQQFLEMIKLMCTLLVNIQYGSVKLEHVTSFGMSANIVGEPIE